MVWPREGPEIPGRFIHEGDVDPLRSDTADVIARCDREIPSIERRAQSPSDEAARAVSADQEAGRDSVTAGGNPPSGGFTLDIESSDGQQRRASVLCNLQQPSVERKARGDGQPEQPGFPGQRYRRLPLMVTESCDLYRHTAGQGRDRGPHQSKSTRRDPSTTGLLAWVAVIKQRNLRAAARQVICRPGSCRAAADDRDVEGRSQTSILCESASKARDRCHTITAPACAYMRHFCCKLADGSGNVQNGL